jgi:3-oxoacyl-[acyl-carrier protein] reductase
MLCTRAALPALIESRGAVVNISSGAVRGSNRGHAAYSAAKAALVGLTRTLAIELGPVGVRVNAVAPGAIESEMTRMTASQLGIDFTTYVEEQSARVPLRRIGQPIDVGNAVCFLVSELSSYITGETMFLAGGPVGGV